MWKSNACSDDAYLETSRALMLGRRPAHVTRLAHHSKTKVWIVADGARVVWLLESGKTESYASRHNDEQLRMSLVL